MEDTANVVRTLDRSVEDRASVTDWEDGVERTNTEDDSSIGPLELSDV